MVISEEHKKNGMIFLGLLFLTSGLFAEETVVDSRGRTILLHDNNTWSVLPGINGAGDNVMHLEAGDALTGFVKSPTGAYSLKYNYSTWKSVKPLNPEAEYAFLNADKKIFSTVIFRNQIISVDELVSATLGYAKVSDPKAEFLDVSDCNINGAIGKLCTYKMKAGDKEIRSMVFVASNPKGSIQYSFVCLAELFEQGKSEMLAEMAGLIF